MKKPALLFFLATLALALPSFAATPAKMEEIRAYARKSVPKCPNMKVDLTPVEVRGPRNFEVFEVKTKGPDESCETTKYLAYSPTTDQVLVGMIIFIRPDQRPTQARIQAQTTEMLRNQTTVTIAPFPLPDGLKTVRIAKATEYGPLTHEGYLDASEQFLFIGTRGNLKTGATKALRDVLMADTIGVKRGNAKGKIEIIELSDFECPTCARAHSMVEPIIKKNLSKISYIRIDLPLFEIHKWAIPAALGAKAIQSAAPAKYWEYVDYLFENQETVGKQAFDQVLKNFAEDHDIPWSKIAPIYTSAKHRAAIVEHVGRLSDNGIGATPTFIINGQVMAFGPNGKHVTDEINALLKSAK